MIAAAVLVLLAAGCGQDGDSAAVRVEGLAFTPGSLRVDRGTAVTWTNGEPISHTVTSGTVTGIDPGTGLRSGQRPDGRFDGRLGGRGARFRFTFAEPGTYSYYCSIHHGMNATVVVT